MMKGHLDRLHFGDLLQWFQMGRVSGRLTLRGGTGDRRLDFCRGRVCFVSSTVPEERLATWIGAGDLLDPEILRRVLATSMLRRELFTDLILAEGSIDSEQLKSSLIDLAERVTGRGLLSPTLDFEFDPDHPVLDVLGLNLDVPPDKLLMEAARHSDESDAKAVDDGSRELPLAGEAFENLFWDLIRSGISADEPVDGQQLTVLHDHVRDIVNTLAQWLASSPGLVPLPARQLETIAASLTGPYPAELFGRPHTTWNHMVFARALHDPTQAGPLTMSALEEAASEMGVWHDMVAADFLARPDADRIDHVVRRLVSVWSRTAAAAAPHIGVDPRVTSLAVHLVSVPTDLVLWVLATLPVPHRRLRKALLHHLSRRVGSRLAQQANFPLPFREILNPVNATPLGVCLNIGRQCLSVEAGWPPTVPDSSVAQNTVASPSAVSKAAEAARMAALQTDADLLAPR